MLCLYVSIAFGLQSAATIWTAYSFRFLKGDLDTFAACSCRCLIDMAAAEAAAVPQICFRIDRLPLFL